MTIGTQNNKVHVIDHPLLAHKLCLLREKDTPYYLFRQLIEEITLLLAFEATRNLTVTACDITTPLCKTQGKTLAAVPTLIPILRAGLGMVDAMLSLMPTSRVGHMGLARNEETHAAENYYFKIPEHAHEGPVFVLDPMLATAGSATSAIHHLQQAGIKDITLINIIAAPEGIQRMQKECGDIPIFVAAIDEKLNELAYIVPGLGDAGDRICGTME